MGYGTGAIMAVPAGDQRDFEFARKFDLPIAAVQMPPVEWFTDRSIEPTADCSAWTEAFVGEGDFINSSNDEISLNGKHSMAESKRKISEWLEQKGTGSVAVTSPLFMTPTTTQLRCRNIFSPFNSPNSMTSNRRRLTPMTISQHHNHRCHAPKSGCKLNLILGMEKRPIDAN
jgi:hypothetical protein